ncbi:lasso peptide biosynthesis B2 protein [Burkholderia oklahomensis]|uniref:lasso peptide biosynthesis B2 protein n=1 Tax=Burkholderia oklahomensis TaxID=342113 RepID=UPI00016A93DB|nr:lasso peptide biosynthesis B2 protein [Burkholderia oklahomensis]AJX30462.1 transglutaminase-like superfamily protein [Burkholderia oklahomensis C6786]AOI46042.1 transglutaminase-like superfamily protein [Burkholderia oklahomensis C6786]KUY54771.1 transglutaminase-like superfamily protein [Burkholderia oklahomensis C6786]MBI0361401.1 lasso peptide biosynthesis B2 protein [Burkholderia oklahomensis]MDN7672946.1 lasso peptide biosynthesis B2 protein [Burkholderia oklahomensis]
MMPARHCHIAVFDQAIVALDIRRSRYFLYDDACAKDFADHYLDLKPIDATRALKPLISDRILVAESPAAARSRIADYRGWGFDAFDSGIWASRMLGKRNASRFEWLPFWRIVRSAASLKMRGFHALSVLDRLDARPANGAPARGDDASHTVERYLRASIWSPFRITCVQMSLALATHLRRENVPAQLVIGVRPMPFVAHAWVEVDGRVCGDEPDLKKSYGEIYRTPRRDERASPFGLAA